MIETTLFKLSEILNAKGYEVKSNALVPPLTWAFDLYAEKEKEALALEFRANDNIPGLFIEKISALKTFPKKLEIYLVFEKIPRSTIISSLKRSGIGVMLFKYDKVFYLMKSQDFSRKYSEELAKSKIKKLIRIKPMHEIIVYPSSKTYEADDKTILKERTIICKVVRRWQRKQFPVKFILTEDYSQGNKNFQQKMLKNLLRSHIFIGVIRENFSNSVKFEFEKAFDIIKDKKLILILKKNMEKVDMERGQTDEKLKKQLIKKQINLIEFVKKRTDIVPYHNLRNFDEKVDRELLRMMMRLFAKNKRELPFQY